MRRAARAATLAVTLAASLTAVLALGAQAQTVPDASPRPAARPAAPDRPAPVEPPRSASVPPSASTVPLVMPSLEPPPDPPVATPGAVEAALGRALVGPEVQPRGSALAVAASIRPEAKPADIAERARAARAAVSQPARVARSPSVRRATGPVGALCGDPRIVGEPLEAIPAALPGCGVEAPVRVSSVGGLTLSRGSVIDCPTARALLTWVEEGVRPAWGRRGGGVTGLTVAAHYACRTRNNRPGARISEHGRGKAIDISAVRLANGTSVTLLEGWRHPVAGPIWRRMHAAACGPFGTVLGPEADRYHQDHLHLDTAARRSRAYCR